MANDHLILRFATRNYESIDVYRSWMAGDEERVQIKQEQFEEAWSARAVGLKVLPLSPELVALIHSKAPDELGEFALNPKRAVLVMSCEQLSNSWRL